jgi:hypothetical protein
MGKRGQTLVIVLQSVPPFAVVVGNPARIVRKIESEWADEHFAAKKKSGLIGSRRLRLPVWVLAEKGERGYGEERANLAALLAPKAVGRSRSGTTAGSVGT